MTYDKKPSVYSDRGTIGSAEELDTYGVWVKSEPQDLTSGMADVADFAAESASFDSGFDAGFTLSESETSQAGIGDFADDSYADNFSESNFIGNNLVDDNFANDSHIADSFDSEIGNSGRAAEEVSTQLLMKIADELSSIRSELATLKREFADIRAEAGSVAAPVRHSDFFAEEEDEKITLTGDEMNNILSSANLSDEDGADFDPQREEDAAALRELSEQKEAAAAGEEEEQEIIDIDFDHLGIDLTYTEEPEESQEPQESAVQEHDSALDDIVFGNFSSEEAVPDEAASGDGFEPLPLEETASLEETPTPDEETFSLSESNEVTELREAEVLHELSEDVTAVDSLDDTDELRELRLEGAAPISAPPDESVYLESDPFHLEDTTEHITSGGEMTLDDAGFDLTLEDFPDEEAAVQSKEESEEVDELQAIEETSIEDTPVEEAPEVISMEEIAIEEAPVEELPVEEATLEELPVEETPSEEVSEEASMDFSEAIIDEPDLSSQITETPLEEPALDDISLSMDDFDLDADFEINDEVLVDAKDNAVVTDNVTDNVKEMDFTLDDFGENINLDMNDNFEKDDGLAKVIPEGFEVNAEEAAVSLDDDFEVFAEEDLSAAPAEEISKPVPPPEPAAAPEAPVPVAEAEEAPSSGGEDNIPSDMKTDLRKVLSYMDHLLESLPEDKIEEFAKSEYFDAYKKLFKDLGLAE